MQSDREQTQRRRRLLREQMRALSMRARAVKPQGGRVRRSVRQGILPFVLKQAKRAAVTARAGLPLIVETMRALGVDEVAGAELPPPKRQRGFAPAQKLEAIVTLLAAGGDRVEDVRVLAEDKGLEQLLGAPFPSPDALLDFVAQFHDPKCWEARPPQKKAWVAPESAGLRA